MIRKRKYILAVIFATPVIAYLALWISYSANKDALGQDEVDLGIVRIVEDNAHESVIYVVHSYHDMLKIEDVIGKISKYREYVDKRHPDWKGWSVGVVSHIKYAYSLGESLEMSFYDFITRLLFEPRLPHTEREWANNYLVQINYNDYSESFNISYYPALDITYFHVDEYYKKARKKKRNYSINLADISKRPLPIYALTAEYPLEGSNAVTDTATSE